MRTAIAAVAIGALAGLAGCSSGNGGPGGNHADAPVELDDIELVLVIRTYAAPYEASLAAGAEAYAEHLGKKLKVITTDGDSQKQLSLVKAAMTRGKTAVINTSVNQSSDPPALAKAVENGKGYITTLWNKEDDVHPKDFSSRWVAHIGFNGEEGGYGSARAMFDQLGGEGGIVAIQGLLGNTPTIERFAGFEDALAEYPGIVLLEDQPGDWDRNKSFDVTQTLLTKYGDQIKGIWAVNDTTAFGAIAALQAAGRTDVLVTSASDAVPEALEAMQAGELITTYDPLAYYTGALGLHLGVLAATGEMDPSEWPDERREFYGATLPVTDEYLQELLEGYDIEEIYASLEEDPWAHAVGALSAGTPPRAQENAASGQEDAASGPRTTPDALTINNPNSTKG